LSNATKCDILFFMSDPGERFLKEQGKIKKASSQRRQLLGCLACRWKACEEGGVPPLAYGMQIMECTGLPSGTIYPLLQTLEDAGVVSSQLEVDAKNRPSRRYYSPIQTELGQAFQEALAVPLSCGLEDTELPVRTTIEDHIAQSSLPELHQIINLALKRIDELTN
jgi:DNA-binding PadR family transcriptional regulator